MNGALLCRGLYGVAGGPYPTELALNNQERPWVVEGGVGHEQSECCGGNKPANFLGGGVYFGDQLDGVGRQRGGSRGGMRG